MPPTHLIPLRARNTAVSDASPTNALHHSSACPHHLPSRDSIFPIVSPNFGETRRDVRCRPRGNSSSNLYLRFAASSVLFHFCHPEEATPNEGSICGGSRGCSDPDQPGWWAERDRD